MDQDNREIFRLVPVRVAPFFVLGGILCSHGGRTALALLVMALLLVAVAFLLLRRSFVSAAALFLGMAVMTGYVQLYVQPLLKLDDTVHRLTCAVTDKHELGGYSSYECITVIEGRCTYITLYYGSDLDIGDRLTADISLSRIAYKGSSPVHRVLLNGSVEETLSVSKPRFSLIRSISRFRERLSDELSVYSDEEHGALVQGLLFGDTYGFPLELSHAAKISGVMHFTAVSGSHFIIIMSVLLELFGRYERVRAVASGIFIFLAVLFFGAEPSVVRAGIMLFLCNCGPLFARKADTLNSLCISVIAMTAFSPYVLMDVGFQMSVLGVFGVTVVGNGCCKLIQNVIRYPRWLRPVVNMIVISACATVCIAPVSVAVFGGISLVGVFATAVFTPLFTLVLVLAVIYAITGMAPIAVFISFLVRLSYELILFFGRDSRLWLVMEYDGAWLLALGTAAALIIAVLFAQRYALRGLMAAVLFVAASFVFSAANANDRRKIEFISDGKSGAAVICFHDEAAIYLCGSGDSIEEQLASCLLQNGIYHLRSVMVTDLTWSGALSLENLNRIYPIESITADSCIEELRKLCPDAAIDEAAVTQITVDGLTMASARSGDTECTADIVLYTGYKMSVPDHGACLLPLYISSRQNYLPEGGINIYDTDFELNLEN